MLIMAGVSLANDKHIIPSHRPALSNVATACLKIVYDFNKTNAFHSSFIFNDQVVVFNNAYNG